MPGYFYICPHCGNETQARTGFELEVGESLTCCLCKGKITAVEKKSKFTFEFDLIKQ
jgi:predicted SprT family Zn-dependent metalloprotease